MIRFLSQSLKQLLNVITTIGNFILNSPAMLMILMVITVIGTLFYLSHDIEDKPLPPHNKWEIEVVYLNGDVDTISYKKIAYKCRHELKFNASGLFSNAGTVPCLIFHCSGKYMDAIACGVRKYRILTHDKWNASEDECKLQCELLTTK